MAQLGNGPLRQIVAYGRRVYDLRRHLGDVTDGRRRPTAAVRGVATAVFFTGLLRVRSFNALEPRLSERPFLRLMGTSEHVKRLCSVDTLGRALRVMDLESVRAVVMAIVRQAERNKVFREGWYGALRYVALDGWEPISSFNRHCGECLVRHVRKEDRKGEVVEVEQYYHRYAVAMLLDQRFDLALDFEPLLPSDLRPVVRKGRKGDKVIKPHEDEGELTAAIRVLKRVKETYNWLDVVVADALYANGPFLTTAQRLGMGAVIVAKEENHEPLKEALSLWAGQPASQVVEDADAKERIELWDCPDIETLETYQGKIRVVRGRVTDLRAPARPTRTWCALVTGKPTKLSPAKVIAVVRSRWHIENTGFHQWTTLWKFAHVFVHSANGIQALYWIFFAAFNLLTLFLYRQVRSYGRDRGKDVTRTISRLIDEMHDDLARLERPIWDTS